MRRAQDNCALKFTEGGNLEFTEGENPVNETAQAQTSSFASGNHSLSFQLLNHHQHFKPDGYDERGFRPANTPSLCNWQPWVVIACTTGKLYKQEKTQQTIVKNLIPYHGVCLLSDKACADSLRAASTHSLYSTTDTLLLAGKAKSILKPCLARVYVCLCLLMCASMCV